MSDLKVEATEPDPSATSLPNDETVNKEGGDSSAPTDPAAETETKPANDEVKEEAVEKIARERIERAARLYSSNQDANRALGIATGTFGRLCQQYGIETPYVRRY